MRRRATSAEKRQFVLARRSYLKGPVKLILNIEFATMSLDEQYLFIRDLIKINAALGLAAFLLFLLEPQAFILIAFGVLVANTQFAARWHGYLNRKKDR
jgi:hypothetical protein